MAAEALSCRVTRRLGRWLSRWGVDADQYHWLLQVSLQMDFRSKSSLQGGRESSGTKSALLQTGLMNLIFSLVIAVSLRAAGVGTFFFSAVTFGYSMTMLAMSILMEFGLAVISPDDFLILAHRPISSRTFFAVKCSNLLFYVLALDLSLNLVPSLVGWTFTDARWHFPLAFLAVAVLAGIFVAAGVAALYGLLLQRVNYERFKDLLAWCQVAFSFLFFFGYQLIPRLVGKVHGFHIEDVPTVFAVALPPFWFASLLEVTLGHFSWLAAALGSVAALGMMLLLPRLLHSVSLDYSDQISRMISAGAQTETKLITPGKGSLTRWLERIVLPDLEERAIFHFLLTMLRRNRLLKMQLYPNFGIVLALFALALLQHEKLADPFTGVAAGYDTMLPVMTFLFAGMGLAASLPYSDEYQGGWIFHVAPIARPGRFLKAVKKAVALVLFAPLSALNVALFSFFWPLAHAVAITLYGLAIGLVTLQVMLFWFRDYPFSRKIEKGTQSRRFATVFVMMMFLGVFMVLPSLFGANTLLVSVVIALLFAAVFVLGYLNNRAYARTVRQLEFEPE